MRHIWGLPALGPDKVLSPLTIGNFLGLKFFMQKVILYHPKT